MSGHVASPCINVCRIDEASGWCAGCLRTVDEIAGWAAYGDGERLRVWRRLPARRVTWLQSSSGPLPTTPEAAP